MSRSIYELKAIINPIFRAMNERVNSLELKEQLREKDKRYIQEVRELSTAVREMIQIYEGGDLTKQSPQAVDLEEAILGALMLESKEIHHVNKFLRVEHFYDPIHQLIYSAMLKLISDGHPVDMRTVVMQLRRNGTIEKVGGAYFIALLTAKVSSGANIEYHARCVIEFAIRRWLLDIGRQIANEVPEDTNDVFELYDAIVDRMSQLKEENFKSPEYA